jgi:hypothetical protein
MWDTTAPSLRLSIHPTALEAFTCKKFVIPPAPACRGTGAEGPAVSLCGRYGHCQRGRSHHRSQYILFASTTPANTTSKTSPSFANKREGEA